MTEADRLPRAHDAERYCIGCLVAYPDRADEVLSRLSATDFVDRLHQKIFAEFAGQHSRGGIIPVLVGKATDSCGYLLELKDDVTTTALVPVEAGKIIEARRKRQLHGIAEAAVEGSLNGHASGDVIRMLTADLDDLKRESQTVIELPKISSFESRAVDWAWEGWLHRGGLTLCDGDPERGKSQITCDVAARWSYPRPFPFMRFDDFRQAGNVLIVATEDGTETTVKPRLEAAGANTDRIHVWPEDEAAITLPSGIDTLAAAVKRYEIGLLIIDPIGAHLDENINANRDADVRRALRPLVTLAQETNMAVVCVRHLNKDENKSAMYRGGGSIAFTAAARVVWAVGTDPNQQERMVMAVLKSNIGKKPPALSYSIEGVGTTSRIRWEGESTCTAGDIFNRKQQRGGKVETAEAILLELLANGSRPETEVREACHNAGIKDWTYKQARKRMKIVSTKGSLREGWLLSLPEEDGSAVEGGGEADTK